MNKKGDVGSTVKGDDSPVACIFPGSSPSGSFPQCESGCLHLHLAGGLRVGIGTQHDRCDFLNVGFFATYEQEVS